VLTCSSAAPPRWRATGLPLVLLTAPATFLAPFRALSFHTSWTSAFFALSCCVLSVTSLLLEACLAVRMIICVLVSTWSCSSFSRHPRDPQPHFALF
jgi:hypothetical protein